MQCRDLIRNWRQAARSLKQSPLTSLAIIAALALGIGANTAIYSILDEALLRPLPLPDSDRLAALYNLNKKTGKYVSTSYPDYEDFSKNAHSFQYLSAYVRLPLKVKTGGLISKMPVEAVTPNYFSMLGLPMAAGRAFSSDDRDTVPSLPSALISERLWRGILQDDPGILGKTILIEDQPFIIAGIVPGWYRGALLNWSDPPQIWITLPAVSRVLPRFGKLEIFHQRSIPWLVMLGRLKPGIPMEQAQAELQVLAMGLAEREARTNRDLTVVAFSQNRAKFWPAYRPTVARSLAAYAVAAGLVLLLACANVSNLLLERWMGRRHETTIRLALGASRIRLVRRLLRENLLLAAAGFLTALAVAQVTQKIFLGFPNALGLQLAMNLSIDRRLMAISALLSILAVLLFGLAPAFHAVRIDIHAALKDSRTTGISPGFHRLRGALVVAQVALCMILLTGGGLFARSLLKAYSVDLGFRCENLITAGFDPAQEDPSGERNRELLRTVTTEMAAIPGVESVTTAQNPPLSMVHSTVKVALATDGADSIQAGCNYAGAGYLHTLQVALAEGRDLSFRDDAAAPKVAIINQTLARLIFKNGQAVGRYLLLLEGPDRKTPVEVIGIARNAKYRFVWEEEEPYLYLAAMQWRIPIRNVIIRTVMKPELLMPSIRRQWSRAVPQTPLDELKTGEDQLRSSLAPQRLAAGLLFSFAALAVALAVIGLYGVIAFHVRQQTRDIGIRIAIGAAPEAVVARIMGKALSLAVMGIALGAGASLALMRFVASQLIGISPFDAITFSSVALLLLAVSSAAAWIPANRAARIDPVQALRDA